MNERIKILRDAAMVREVGHSVFGESESYWSLDEDKFAQLIIADCVARCQFVAKLATITNDGEMARKTKATADSCAKMINDHFGIKNEGN